LDNIVIAFPKQSEFEKAKVRLLKLSLPFDVLNPAPGYRLVGSSALVMSSDTMREVYSNAPNEFISSGWLEYRPAGIAVPDEEPPEYDDDIFGIAAVMVLALCVADRTKIRIIAHISKDISPAFPFLNAEMKEASFNPVGETLTFMDGYRMVSLYPHRITVAKADELVDAWRTLDMIRRRVNDVWARRSEITPSYEKRTRPPALEILKRLPMTNCRACGEQTCTAFAVRVWQGEITVSHCTAVFSGEFSHLREALVEICSGLGVGETVKVENNSYAGVDDSTSGR
jgi:ArsR family metal-binding transcriptional regulator